MEWSERGRKSKAKVGEKRIKMIPSSARFFAADFSRLWPVFGQKLQDIWKAEITRL